MEKKQNRSATDARKRTITILEANGYLTIYIDGQPTGWIATMDAKPGVMSLNEAVADFKQDMAFLRRLGYQPVNGNGFIDGFIDAVVMVCSPGEGDFGGEIISFEQAVRNLYASAIRKKEGGPHG